MRYRMLAAAACAVAAMTGCDQPRMTGPDRGQVNEGGPGALPLRATLPRVEADDLFARLLPDSGSPLGRALRSHLDRERIGEENVRAALVALDGAPAAERDPVLGAVRLTLEAMLRSLSALADSAGATTP